MFAVENHLKYKFLDLDLFIVSLLSSFVITGVQLPPNCRFFCGAFLSVVSLKILVICFLIF